MPTVPARKNAGRSMSVFFNRPKPPTQHKASKKESRQIPTASKIRAKQSLAVDSPNIFRICMLFIRAGVSAAEKFRKLALAMAIISSAMDNRRFVIIRFPFGAISRLMSWW